MIALLVNLQVLADGVCSGLVVGLIAMGIVLVYRSSRIINFAVAAMGLPGAALVALLVLQYHVPYWLAVPVGLVAGAAFAATAELIVVRRLFRAPRVILLVATLGLSQLALAITLALPDVVDPSADYPTAIGHRLRLGSLGLSGPDLMIVIAVPMVAGALGWLMNRTRFGHTVAASADNPDLARVSGISPKRASTLVWTVAGGVSTLSMILIANQSGNVSQVATLGPATLARGLIVALLAGMVSFPRALVAGIALGVAEAVIGFNTLGHPGTVDALLLVAAIVAIFLQTRQGRGDDDEVFSFTPRAKPVPREIAGRWWVRHHGRILFVVVLVAAAIVPLVVTAPSRSYLYASIVCFALVALSVTVITGWAGQLSLGQMAFAGFGALGTAALVRGLTFTLVVPGGGHVSVVVHPWPLLPAMAAMAVLTALLAAVVGIGALRVRGLLLAVSTFVFAFAAQQYFFQTAVLTGGTTPPVALPRGHLFGIDLTVQRSYYWLVLAIAAVAVAVVARLRRSGPGRKMVAVRDNAEAAAAYTVDATRTKLFGFVLSGFLAGLAGGLLGALTQNIDTNQLFVVGDSLTVVAMAVIGGLGTIAGPIVGAVWVVGLPAFFPGNALVPLFASSIGLLVLLLYFPGGLAQVGYAIRDAVFARAARRTRAAEPSGAGHARPPVSALRRPEPRGDGPALVATGMSVTFGGLRAVDDVSIEVRPGQVVGLIGTNGSGKSTLLNALGGYVGATGRITIGDTEVTHLPAHRRARLGLGRTFQQARLFPELTVHQTLMVALEARRRSSIVATALALPTAGRAERASAAEADEILDFLGLGAYADHHTAELSTGTRRIVELAGLLAVDARILCLDEPTSGVAQRETEAFGPLLEAIRAELDAAVLVIEHDMGLIMSLSDRVVCLEAGRVIAEGTPDQVRHDPLVITSYLGTDRRAIDRSDATFATPVPRSPATP